MPESQSLAFSVTSANAGRVALRGGSATRRELRRNLQERGVGRWSTKNRLVPSGKLWPNGELSLGFARLERDDSPPRPVVSPSYSRTVLDIRAGAVRLELRYCTRALALALILGSVGGRLGLSMVRNSHKSRKKNGLKGITGYGKKMVRSGAALLQRRYGRDCLSFLTLTVPALEVSELEAVASNWGGLVNRLTQFLQRQLRKRSLPVAIVSVTELQPKRLEASDLGCLHLHAVFAGRHDRKSPWCLKPQEIREWWLCALSRIVGRPVESNSVENLQRVRKSADGYLGKYMSKGADGARKLAEMYGTAVVPGQWWNMTACARSWVKSETLSGSIASGYIESLIESHFDGDWLRSDVWIQAHYRAFDGRVILSGYSGRLDSVQYQDLRDTIKEHLALIS